jgi:hypothetical protein
MIEADDLLSEAKSLQVAAHSSETRRRTVIVCAYYAAYHKVAPYAYSLGHRYNKDAAGGSHFQLVEFLRKKRYEDEIIDEFLDVYRPLRTRRERASYHLDDTMPTKDAQDAVDRAEEIFEILSAASEGETRHG